MDLKLPRATLGNFFFSYLPLSRVGNKATVVLKVSLLLLLHGQCSFFHLAHSTTGKWSTPGIGGPDRDLPEAPSESFHTQHATSDDAFLLLLLPLHGGWGIGKMWKTLHTLSAPRNLVWSQYFYVLLLTVGVYSSQKSTWMLSWPTEGVRRERKRGL